MSVTYTVWMQIYTDGEWDSLSGPYGTLVEAQVEAQEIMDSGYYRGVEIRVTADRREGGERVEALPLTTAAIKAHRRIARKELDAAVRKFEKEMEWPE